MLHSIYEPKSKTFLDSRRTECQSQTSSRKSALHQTAWHISANRSTVNFGPVQSIQGGLFYVLGFGRNRNLCSYTAVDPLQGAFWHIQRTGSFSPFGHF